MKKELVLGITAVATAGAITVLLLANSAAEKDAQSTLVSEEQASSNSEKIEELYFEELQNTDKYTFCMGKEKIQGEYRNSLLGSETGQVAYAANELILIEKNTTKMLILGRDISYTYTGTTDVANTAGTGSIDTQEHGETVEYYKKNMAPVHADLTAAMFYPSPSRKTTDWVTVLTKSRGTVLSQTLEDSETTYEDAKVFCGPYSITQSLPSDTSQTYTFKGTCPESSPTPGISFSGNFEFTCEGMSSSRAVELLKEYQQRERAALEERGTQTARTSANGAATQQNENSGDTTLQDALSEDESETQNTEDIQKKIDSLKDEMQADMRFE